MELDRFKSAWQKQPTGADLSFSPPAVSQSLQWLRTSTIRDLQGSEELSRLIFSLLFALAVGGASFAAMPAGSGRVVAWLFATALLVDGIGGVVLMVRRLREPATSTVLEFISREELRAESRIKLDQYSQGVMLALAALTVILLVFGPRPVNFNDDVMRMGIATAFLAVTWRRTKSRSRVREIRHELRTYLKDLKG